MPVSPSDDNNAMLRLLSAAPPDQWGPCLQALGASVHRVGREGRLEDEDSGPPTVSSLLAMLEGKGGQDSAPSAGSMDKGTPLSQTRGSRARAKRKAAVPVASAPAQEDGRDLEALLRDLGEESVPRSTKASRAAQKKTGKSSKPSGGTRKATLPPPSLTITSQVGADEQDEAASSDSSLEAEGTACKDTNPATCEEATSDACEEANCDICKESSDSERHEESATERPEDYPLEVADVEPTEPSVAETVEEAEAEAAQSDSFSESTAEPEDSHPRRQQRLRSLSEGRLPTAYHQTTPPHEQEPTLPYRSPSFFQRQPSVATWIQPARFNATAASSSCAAEALPKISWCQPPPGCWNHQPSAQTRQPLAETAPFGSRAQVHSSSGQEVQFWPDTPTSTPPSSPRGKMYEECTTLPRPGGVVWVPVPVHLLAKVQQLIGDDVSGDIA